MTDRAQSEVVGVTLLIGVTVVSLAAVTAGVGAMIDANAATADASRVADTLEDVVRPSVGERAVTVAFADGRLDTVERSVRVLNASGSVLDRRTAALVFSSGEAGARTVGGAVVVDGARGFIRPPRVTAAPGVLALTLPVVLADVTVHGTDVRASLRTTVSSRRIALENDTYRVAIETATPGPWRRWFARANATVTAHDFDGDGIESVVAAFPGQRRGYVVVREVEVSRDG